MINEPSSLEQVASPASKARVGYYCWGGPGTIRMIKVKFFNPRIDIQSHMTCYDYDYLARVQDLFGVTDFWATYSWGFADTVEEEDRRFLVDRVDNFKRLGIRLHAYIQGPNLVYEDFKDTDWWARDEKNRLITYYRGRKVCSIHHDGYVQYVIDKIEATYGLGFDGIYIDNIQHGQLGAPTQAGSLPFVFCGDYSQSARRDFFEETGCDIPDDFEQDPDLTKCYLDFRVKSNTRFVTQLAMTAHAGGMAFGTNFYDPKFDPTFIYGIDLAEMAAVQDYVLFENHSLPRNAGRKHNGYINQVIEKYGIGKPTFVVTYHDGVGFAPQFTQSHIDNVFSEAAQANFLVCLKGSEFTTGGIWHCLYLDHLSKPNHAKPIPRHQPKSSELQLVEVLLTFAVFRQLAKRFYNPIVRVAFEWQIFRILLRIVYEVVLK